MVKKRHALLLALALTASAGCSKKPAFYAPVLVWFKGAGFEVGKFAKTAAEPYGAAECAQGQVDKLDLLICQYKDKAAAEGAEQRFAPFLKGALSGAMRQRERLMLAVADRDKVDPKGERIDKLLKTFALKDRD